MLMGPLQEPFAVASGPRLCTPKSLFTTPMLVLQQKKNRLIFLYSEFYDGGNKVQFSILMLLVLTRAVHCRRFCTHPALEQSDINLNQSDGPSSDNGHQRKRKRVSKERWLVCYQVSPVCIRQTQRFAQVQATMGHLIILAKKQQVCFEIYCSEQTSVSRCASPLVCGGKPVS